MTDAVLMFGYSRKTPGEIRDLDKSDKERYIAYDLKRYLIEFDSLPVHQRFMEAVNGSKNIDRAVIVGDSELKSIIGGQMPFVLMGHNKLENAQLGWKALGQPNAPVAYLAGDSPALKSSDIDELVNMLSEGVVSYPLISMNDNEVWRSGKNRYLHFNFENSASKSEKGSTYMKEVNGLGLNFASLNVEGLENLVENTKLRGYKGLQKSISALGSYTLGFTKGDDGRFSLGKTVETMHYFGSAIAAIGQSIISKKIGGSFPPDVQRITRAAAHFLGTQHDLFYMPVTSNPSLAMDMDSVEDAFVIMYVLAKRKDFNEQISKWEELRDRITYRGQSILRAINISGHAEKAWFERMYQERGSPENYASLV